MISAVGWWNATVDRGGRLEHQKDFRAEYWPARSTTPDGTLSLPNSGTRLRAPGDSGLRWIRVEPAKCAYAERPCPRRLRSVGMNARHAGCRRLVTSSARKSYCNARGAGVRGIT